MTSIATTASNNQGLSAEELLWQEKHGFQSAVADETVTLTSIFQNKRLQKIAWLTTCFFLSFISEVVLASIGYKKDTGKQAIRLRRLFEDLGPTFIKIGQFLSFRGDILPKEFVLELRQLQDKVPPFPFPQAKEIIEKDLQSSLYSIFLSFDVEPVASASLGQVHKAMLYDGKAVAVKVQRPDLKAIFYQDIGYLRLVARIFSCLGQKQQSKFLLELSKEFGNMLFAEIDYIAEGRNADKLRRLLYLNPQIIVPRVVWKLTSYRILTTEYISGIKIDQVDELEKANINLHDLADLIVESFVNQIVSASYFHADPHAGNLAVTSDGRLIFYDFGMIGHISAREKQALVKVAHAIIEGNVELLSDSLIDLKIVDRQVERNSLQHLLSPIINCYRGQDLNNLDLTKLDEDIDRLIKNNVFHFPVTLAYLLRAATAIEGVVRQLKPNFNFARSLSSHFHSRLAISTNMDMKVLVNMP